MVRVSGGKVHTYCFHGPMEDETVVNVQNRSPFPQLEGADKEYLRKFPNLERAFAGDAPDKVEATFRLDRAYEMQYLSAGWNAALPRQYTRFRSSTRRERGCRRLLLLQGRQLRL